MELMFAPRKSSNVGAYVQFFGRKPVFSGLVVFLTLVGMLADSIGLLTLVPMLDILTSDGASSVLAVKILALWQAFGLQPGLKGILVAFIFLLTLRGLVRVARDWAATRLRSELTDDLRQEALTTLMAAEWSWLAGHKRSDQTNMLLTEVQRAGTGVFAVLSLLATSAALLAYFLTAVSIEPSTTVLAAFVCGLMLFLFRGLRRKALSLGQEQLLVNRRLNEHALESVHALKLAKILGSAEHDLCNFDRAASDLRKNQVRFSLLSGVSRELFQIVGGILVAGYVAAGVSLWQIPLPELLVMVLILVRMVPMLTTFQQYLQMTTNALPALLEAQDIIAQARIAAEPNKRTKTPAILLTEELCLSKVCVSLSEKRPLALDDVSLRLPAGSTTIITGHSGAGKSTLADVLMGLLKPIQGEIMIDGNVLGGSDRILWRQSVSYVPQEIALYNGSVRSNLLRAKPSATYAEIEGALSAASADFVHTLPHGIDTVIGDGAHGLSGGEKQRLALARGLLRSPSLLVLDEVTSALDWENELKIRDSVARLSGQMTIVILGHSNAFLEIADQVLWMEGGKLADKTEV